MNCKQGDLAIVVDGLHNLGKIVRCVRLKGGKAFWNGRTKMYSPLWETDSLLKWVKINNPNDIRLGNEAPDSCLKPIPDDLLTQEEKDEIMKGTPVAA